MKIIKSFGLVLSIALMAVSVSFAQTTAVVDVANSKVNWEGKKVVGKHNGTINISEGTLNFAEGKLTGGNFTIDMTSITCTDMQGKGAKKLEGHLHSDDFFSTADHPSSNLVITKVTPAGTNYSITGDLTIKGITKPITFEATAGQYLATAKVKVDRTAYDIKYGSGSFFDNLGDKAIDNEFTLDINLVLSTSN